MTQLCFISLAKKVTIREFDGSEGDCKELYRVLQQSDPKLFTQTKALDDALLSDGFQTFGTPAWSNRMLWQNKSCD